MDEKRMFSRSKRQKPPDEGAWDCSVCTYKNSPEAYKCEMCDVRKGTSTRKPRLNSQLVAQQVAQQYVPPPPKKEKLENGTLEEGEEEEEEEEEEGVEQEEEREEAVDSDSTQEDYRLELPPPPIETTTLNTINIKKEKNHTNTAKKNTHQQRSARLRNVDRSSAREIAVTVGTVTVTITDYQPKRERKTSTETSSNVTLDSFDNSSSSSGVSNDPREDVTINTNNHQT
ncbi:RING1 and YY1-binding protein-like isoform X2 [Pecten maximus]|uniref:RING1 and YY1-binding protein-like isoform X2 n=1 Tax=Pecten maximus TaxID=6579 RepID=UPI001458244E|nr:RING1 and YY1-binding protein-like isoform X2 [Pecten maximus]